MPKARSIKLTMSEPPPLSIGRWIALVIVAVTRPKKDTIRFEMIVPDDPRQAGRRIHHDFPAALTMKSSLAAFLDAHLGISLAMGETLDLASLVGRRLEAKFAKDAAGNTQKIVAFRPTPPPATNKTPRTSLLARKEENDG